ncbi:MAG: pyruvate formate-lyase-activating protein [Tissierellia bacterium]|nr:pyruvate formate-lyase-activating protein [Tissierellia bacterium]
MIGRYHSLESCGTVDGPGVRFLVFLQGCPLRCQYCHNADTWDPNGGKEISVDDLMKEIRKYKNFMKFSGGGVTISGGEPMLQKDFVTEVFRQCKVEGIHTALDTSGFLYREGECDELLSLTDMVLLDMKSYDNRLHKKVTGVSNCHTLAFAKHLEELGIPVWARFVLVPGLTDSPENLDALGEFIGKHKNIERLELLPFHKMGEYKWRELGLSYKLDNTREPKAEEVLQAKTIFEEYGIYVA